MRYLLIAPTIFFTLGCQTQSKPNPQTQPSSAGASLAPVSKPAPATFEYQVFAAALSASSFLESGTGGPYTRYHPNYAMDNNPKTAWNEGAEGSGAGEWLSIPMDAYDIQKIKLRILNGYQASEKLFSQNARIKTLQLTLFPDKKITSATLPDTMGWQEVFIEADMGALSSIELKVIEVYPGNKFQDLAITDVELMLTSKKPGDVQIQKENHQALLTWIEEQRSLKKGIPSGYRVESVQDAPSDPFPPEAADFIARAKTAMPSKTLLPIRLEPKDDVGVPIRFDKLACMDFGDENTHRDIDAGSFEVPCSVKVISLDYRGNRNDVSELGTPVISISGLKLIKTRKPASDDCDVSIWIDPSELTSGKKVRTLLFNSCATRMEARIGIEESEVQQAVVFDEYGRIRVLYDGDMIQWFAWRRIDGEDVLQGGIRTRRNPAKSNETLTERLIPEGIALPDGLAASTPTSTPASLAASAPTSTPNALPTSTPSTRPAP